MKIKTKRGARRIRNQRVVTRRFVVTDYTGCPYITAGKRYEYTGDDDSGTVINNDKFVAFILLGSKLCSHLGYTDTWRYAVI